MLPLDLRALEAAGVTYYTGNLHKWVCAPKGAAFLHVAAERLERVRPLSISHGANAVLRGRTRFRVEFDWTGTADLTPFLSVPHALRVMGAMLPGGWEALREANRALALEARDLLCEALGVAPPAPDAMLGAMAAVPLGANIAPGLDAEALNTWLWTHHHIEVPVSPWPDASSRLLRISAQRYNTRAQYAHLAAVLQSR
jgi:isopenicillin-N epimerase